MGAQSAVAIARPDCRHGKALPRGRSGENDTRAPSRIDRVSAQPAGKRWPSGQKVHESTAACCRVTERAATMRTAYCNSEPEPEPEPVNGRSNRGSPARSSAIGCAQRDSSGLALVNSLVERCSPARKQPHPNRFAPERLMSCFLRRRQMVVRLIAFATWSWMGSQLVGWCQRPNGIAPVCILPLFHESRLLLW